MRENEVAEEVLESRSAHNECHCPSVPWSRICSKSNKEYFLKCCWRNAIILFEWWETEGKKKIIGIYCYSVSDNEGKDSENTLGLAGDWLERYSEDKFDSIWWMAGFGGCVRGGVCDFRLEKEYTHRVEKVHRDSQDIVYPDMWVKNSDF